MTQNQIAYWQFRETERANKAKEAETHRANVTAEKETQRSHRVGESINLLVASEQMRHNMETESLQGKGLEESYRHNVVTEGEAIRSNIAREQETQRHNQVSESLGYYQAGAQYASAAAAMENARVSAMHVSENVRHNQQAEALQFGELANKTRYNELYYLETVRDNVATVGETSRYNTATETESMRHNEQSENVDKARVFVDGLSSIARGVALFSQPTPSVSSSGVNSNYFPIGKQQ